MLLMISVLVCLLLGIRAQTGDGLFEHSIYLDAQCTNFGNSDNEPFYFTMDDDCSDWMSSIPNSLEVHSCSANCICFTQYANTATCGVGSNSGSNVKESCTHLCQRDEQGTYLQLSALGCPAEKYDPNYSCGCTGMDTCDGYLANPDNDSPAGDDVTTDSQDSITDGANAGDSNSNIDDGNPIIIDPPKTSGTTVLIIITLIFFLIVGVVYIVRRKLADRSPDGSVQLGADAVQQQRTVVDPNPRTTGATTDDAPLPEGWEEVTGDQGETYFWNRNTNKTQWDPP